VASSAVRVFGFFFFLIIVQEKIDTVTVEGVENAEEEEVEWLGHVE
jgi:hypothetical protein